MNRGLLLATCLLVAYEARCVLQVMHYHQRFYYPALPALMCLALDGLGAVARGTARLRRSATVLAVLATLAVLGLLAPFARELHAHWRKSEEARHVGRFGLLYGYQARWRHLWHRLDQVSALPDDLVIATTEVGLPAVLNPRKTIVDLSGLNTPAIARHGFSAEALFRAAPPDIFYMPHADNRRMDEAIRAHPYFEANYDYWPARQLGTLLGVAIHRRSPHYAALRAAIEGGVGAR